MRREERAAHASPYWAEANAGWGPFNTIELNTIGPIPGGAQPGGADPGSANCPYCGEGVRGSTRHLLAECQHPQLIVARTRATQQLRRVVVELAERADPHARGEWSDGFL